MTNFNMPQAAPKVNIVGELSFLRVSKMLQDDTFIYDGPPENVFYGVNGPKDQPPKLYPNRSAFIIKIMATGAKPQVFRSFLALVLEVRSYEIKGNSVHLDIKYAALNEDDETAMNPTVTIADHPTRIFSNGECLALFYEGDVEYLGNTIRKDMKAFIYGGRVYHLNTVESVKKPVGTPGVIDNPYYPVGVFVTASTKKLADMDEMTKTISAARFYFFGTTN